MVSREKILDDLARVAGGAATLLGEAGKQANESFRNRIDQFAQGGDLVPRKDFDRLELMLESALEEVEALKMRVESLEGSTKGKAKAKKLKAGKRTTPNKEKKAKRA